MTLTYIASLLRVDLIARKIGRYVKHPPIAESRITGYDGELVTFWYEDTKTKQKTTVTMDKFEFVHRLLGHVPEKNFKIVRYIGLYSKIRLIYFHQYRQLWH